MPMSPQEARILLWSGYLMEEYMVKETLLKIIQTPTTLELYQKYNIKQLAQRYVEHPQYHHFALALIHLISGIEGEEIFLPDILPEN